MKITPINKQSGFSLVEVLLTFIFIGVLVLIGWRVMDTQSTNQKNEDKTTQQAATPKNESKKVAEKPAIAPGEIKRLTDGEEVTLIFPADVAKLPEGTPESYKNYMKVQLAANETGNECVAQYTVSTISTVNIGGGTASADRQTMKVGDGNCGGGARTVWSLKDDVWRINGFQAIPSCKLLSDNAIYSEWLESCDNGDGKISPNPMGSISQLKD